MNRTPQFELPGASDVFNLASETGIDPLRLLREAEAERRSRAESAEYVERMQLTLAQCPGYIGSDAPTGPGVVGRAVVEPAMSCEAMQWLKRRFHVDENLNLSLDSGPCFNVMARQRSKGGGHRVRVSFAKPEQFHV